MSQVFLDTVIFAANKNLDYGKRLLADVPQEKMIYQPAPKTNHPAWVFSHLNIYFTPMCAMIEDKPFEDPKGSRFGMTSKPETDASLYASKEVLLAEYVKGYESVIAALKAKGPAILEIPTPLERWRASMPQLGVVLNYLLVLHVATHLGQLSTWRRVQGMPSV